MNRQIALLWTLRGTSSNRANDGIATFARSPPTTARCGAAWRVRYFERHHTPLPNLSYPLKVRRCSVDVVSSPSSTQCCATLGLSRSIFVMMLLPGENRPFYSVSFRSSRLVASLSCTREMFICLFICKRNNPLDNTRKKYTCTYTRRKYFSFLFI